MVSRAIRLTTRQQERQVLAEVGACRSSLDRLHCEMNGSTGPNMRVLKALSAQYNAAIEEMHSSNLQGRELMQQQFLDTEWLYFCEVCGDVEHDGPSNGRVICMPCWLRSERERARQLGIPFTDEDSDTAVSDMLDSHRHICEYISLVWNDVLRRTSRDAIIHEGRWNCPWEPHNAHGVPHEEIDRTALQIFMDDDLAHEIDNEWLDRQLAARNQSTWEREPNGGRRIIRAVWPAVERDQLYQRIADMLWQEWKRFLPYKVIS